MKRVAAIAAVALLVLVAGGAAADSFTLTVVSQTNSTITFSYPAQQGYGYLYSANGTVVSRTNDPTKTQVKFAKNVASDYEVAAIAKGATGRYQPTPPAAQCADTLDNDSDGKVDLADPGCSSSSDNDETDPVVPKPACSDTLDNDGDGKVDYPADPGCTSATDTDETDSVSPPPTTITPTQFSARATSGATIDNVTVTGDVIVRNPNVTLKNSTIQGSIEWYNLADGGKMLNSKATDLFIWGADNLLVDGNTFDGGNHTLGGKMWDMGGDVPQNVTITNNTFRNQNTGNSADHSQAMFVGYSNGVLISGNTFVNNGSTADLFFSWYTETNPGTNTYPRNVCVKGNSFSDPNDLHFFAINFRSEITTAANIKTDPNEPGFSTTSPQFNGTC